ncbi:MAG TPA: hypothetical protein VEQ11_02945 [Chloroflexota bacterium]|nr:hypothetical protein [Chloroflexota bacterium]
MRQAVLNVVRKDAPHGVGVADVHVPVEEARRHHEMARIDDAVGTDLNQVGSLTHIHDVLPVDQNRPVLDDPSLLIDGHDEAGVLDLER